MSSILRIARAASAVQVSFQTDSLQISEERRISFSITPQDAEDLRWYLEDYRVYPLDPEPAIAKRIQRRIPQIGSELFDQILSGGDLWDAVHSRLRDTTVEVETDLEDSIPWELIRDPITSRPLA